MLTPRTSGSQANSFWTAYSLRTRYLAVTVLVALIIITGVLLAQSYVRRASHMRNGNFQLHSEASQLIHQLRGSLLETEDNLQAYLRRPGREKALLVESAMSRAIVQQKQLYQLERFENHESAVKLDDFGRDLMRLQISVDHLMRIRIDPDNKDALDAIRFKLFQPASRGFNESVDAILRQLELPENTAQYRLTHQRLQELRAQWININKFTEAFSGKSSIQPGKFEQLLKLHQALLGLIDALDQTLSGFPPRSSIQSAWQEALAYSEQWSDGLELLEIVAFSGAAPGDINRVETSTEQQFVHIRQYLYLLDSTPENFSSRDSATLNDITGTATRTLWILALLGIALLVTAATYFERNILAPITQVARALLAEAHGEPHAPLLAAQSRETLHLLEAFNEMHRQVQQRQQSLEHLALHDSLTGLANREQLVRAIQQALNSSTAGERALALLVIGLNRFKEINNSLGHSVGDQLLVAVGKRLTMNNPKGALIARLNGVGFALLIPGSAGNEADEQARRIIKIIESPFDVENQSLYISATIGIVFSPEHGGQPLELLQKAEVAMAAAKQQKMDLIHYNSEHDLHALRRLALANALRREINDPQGILSLVYQPQIEMRSGRVYGMEALLRWNPPHEGSVAPDELIPIAEQTGLIYQLTPWVIERAFQEYSSMRTGAGVKPTLAINLSSLNLHDTELPRTLQRLLEKWAINPASLQLEITESAMMADPERAHCTLGLIHSLGVELTIDDFGTGFSSLAYLKHLPVNKLKIDKSFVISMLHDENDAVIIRSTIDMAHNMGLKVVAEGVENQETYDLLEILDCDIVQGYMISAPLDIAALEQWIPLQRKAKRHRQPLYADHCPG